MDTLITDNFGNPTLTRHADGTVTVEGCTQLIGVTPDLWENLRPEHRTADDVLVLDTAGVYRYRHAGWSSNGMVMVFQRLADTTTGGAP